MNKKLMIMLGAGALTLAAAGGGAWRFLAAGQAAPNPEAEAKAAARARAAEQPSKYVTLDKVIVMLRRAPGETANHYLATDLVLATTEKQEKLLKEHLPLLRSIVVRTLSAHTMAEASSMTVEQVAGQLNKSFEASYASQERDKPFSDVMIGRLIIE
jgi:flagellar FliL protein